jgi:hypothetical protein
MTIIARTTDRPKIGESKPKERPAECAAEATKAEWELGIPPALSNKAQFQRRVRKNSRGTLMIWASAQEVRAGIRIGFEKAPKKFIEAGWVERPGRSRMQAEARLARNLPVFMK